MFRVCILLFVLSCIGLATSPSFAQKGEAVNEKDNATEKRDISNKYPPRPFEPSSTVPSSAERKATKTSTPWQRGIAVRRIGLRATATSVFNGSRTRWAGAGLVSQDALAYFDVGRLSVRYLDFAGIGYGSASLEGGLGADLAMGIRMPITESVAAILRAGLRAYLFGNDLFYTSSVELPQVQAGVDWSNSRIQVEIAARGGLVLVGRYRVGQLRVKPGQSPTLGAFGSFRIPNALVEFSWTHLFAEGKSNFSDYDEIRAIACAVPHPLVVCADVGYKRAGSMDKANTAHPARGRTVYVGATLSIADMEWR